MNHNKLWVRLMEFGEVLGCHQMPQRSFFYKGYQFPVCARCTGVIISSVLATVVFFIKKLPLWICIILSSVMLIDWGLQFLHIKESTNKRRIISGFIGGFGWTTLYLRFIFFIFNKVIQIFYQHIL